MGNHFKKTFYETIKKNSIKTLIFNNDTYDMGEQIGAHYCKKMPVLVFLKDIAYYFTDFDKVPELTKVRKKDDFYPSFSFSNCSSKFLIFSYNSNNSSDCGAV